MKGHKLLYGASALMVLGFLIHVVIDRYQYSSTLNSAPFWVWIVSDAVLWLIPALLAFIAGYAARKSLMKKEKMK